MTKGNEEKRYVGKTDEELSPDGIRNLKEINDFHVDVVYSSPMKRCLQSAEILFPKAAHKICEQIKECDFGMFEYKNFSELRHNEEYIKWLDSGGKSDFPMGENLNVFKKRCIDGFLRIVKNSDKNKFENIAIVTHGGVIMAVFEKFADGNFYDWQIKNGEGLSAEFDMAKSSLHNIERL